MTACLSSILSSLRLLATLSLENSSVIIENFGLIYITNALGYKVHAYITPGIRNLKIQDPKIVKNLTLLYCVDPET